MLACQIALAGTQCSQELPLLGHTKLLACVLAGRGLLIDPIVATVAHQSLRQDTG